MKSKEEIEEMLTGKVKEIKEGNLIEKDPRMAVMLDRDLQLLCEVLGDDISVECKKQVEDISEVIFERLY